MFLSPVFLVENIGLLAAEAITGEPNDKNHTFNKEPSPDNDEVTALELIPTPNGPGVFDDIGG